MCGSKELELKKTVFSLSFSGSGSFIKAWKIILKKIQWETNPFVCIFLLESSRQSVDFRDPPGALLGRIATERVKNE